jgi:DNA-directed RNA polymerase specialized sigma24 family protein
MVKMKIPKNMTKEEVIETIQKVAKRVSYNFRFAFYDVEDIEQEAFIIGMEALDRYDETRPLENFLFVHIKNRLKNFKRDNYIRYEPEKPWNKDVRKIAKKSLMEPINLDNVMDYTNNNMSQPDDFIDAIQKKEYLEFIDRNLDMSYRGDYLRMLHGVHVPKPRRDEIIETIRDLLRENLDEEGKI